MRDEINFSDGWLFIAEQAAFDLPDGVFEPVTLPHTNRLIPLNYFDDADYQFISTYRKRFKLSQPRQGRRVQLTFEGVMVAASVTINDYTFETQRGGYIPFTYDITDYLHDEGENLLTVLVDSTERPDIPPFGHVVDYLTFGGIYREVTLRYVEPCYIHDVFVKSHGLLDDPHLEFVVTLRNQSSEAQAVAVVGGMAYWKDEFALAEVPPKGVATVTLWTDLTQMPRGMLKLWSPDHPHLHEFNFGLFLQAGINSMDEVKLDAVMVRSGLRHAEFREDGFYLNGERLYLMGLNRHQNYPYIGAAAPARLQRKDAEIIRYDLGCNIVRTSHYPQSKHFLNRCDEIGLLVLEEIPGWQHIGDAFWQDIALRDVRAMIERDRNHPSIVVWGVRINESLDNTTFYQHTNALAHEIDPTRQTIGTRFWQFSEFLENVYGFNDFSGHVQEPENTPHLITEFAGHTFPTKSFDQEERLIDHALLHTRIQNQARGMGKVTGAIGWCAFDYHTHRQFGSGDRICYHGVMDIFRLPKFASYFYAGQGSRIVLFPATHWTMGDRSHGGNNPLIVFSNCDEIEVFIGAESQGRFQPDRANYPHLAHPPFHIQTSLAWGQDFDDLRVVGYQHGEIVAERILPLNSQPSALQFTADDAEIHADGADMTRLSVMAVDQHGNRLPYFNSWVEFTVEGDAAQIIGDNPFVLVGGQGAVYLKATHQAGTVRVVASSPRLPDAEVVVRII